MMHHASQLHVDRLGLFGEPTLTSFMQPSKSVSMDSTRAPLAIGCTSCAMEILSAGRNTMDGMPACAQ